MKTLSAEEKMILVPISILLSVGLIFIYPVAIMLMWNWFIAPLFELIYLTYLAAFGLYLFITVLPISRSTKANEETNHMNDIALYIAKYIGLGVILVIALIVKGLM